MFPDFGIVQAAADHQLSASPMLATLLQQEDNQLYQQLLHIQLPQHIHNILHQLSALLHLSTSTLWMATMLLKQLTHLQQPISLVTVIASVTLSSKYQHSSIDTIDYSTITQHFQLEQSQLIHDAEMDLLDALSYDVSVITPDHFFSYLSNLIHVDTPTKQMIDQARSSLLHVHISSSSHERLELLSHYPSSIVTLALMYAMDGSNAFVMDQMKVFLQHKRKDATHYFTQLAECIAQLQSSTA